MAIHNKDKQEEGQTSRQNKALKNFQNQEHNTQKEALGPNTKR